MSKNKKKYKICVIGLGYVGLPLLVEINKKYIAIGFDIEVERIKELREGYDRTNELTKDIIEANELALTSSEEKIKDYNIYIVTVPTPVDKNKKPDLRPLISASTLVGRLLEKGNIVIYESTVFPGCTEDVCVPVLETESKLIFNKDFFCGYSPERINPGDKDHTLINIKKIVSGSSKETLDIVDQLYSNIVTAGTFRTSSIKVAEAAKIIENTQRDVNIALINELALIFNKLNINTKEVLDAASTKWNFLQFYPGLVGGHCIGVDPYYLTYKAAEVGYHPEIILAGRKINDNMGYFIAENTIAQLANIGKNISNAKIAILGLTFKEDCPDMRNTKVSTIIEFLLKFKCSITISDEYANKKEAVEQFGINLSNINEIQNQDAIIVAVGHRLYKNFTIKEWSEMIAPGGLIVDVKSLYKRSLFLNLKMHYWSL